MSVVRALRENRVLRLPLTPAWGSALRHEPPGAGATPADGPAMYVLEVEALEWRVLQRVVVIVFRFCDLETLPFAVCVDEFKTFDALASFGAAQLLKDVRARDALDKRRAMYYGSLDEHRPLQGDPLP